MPITKEESSHVNKISVTNQSPTEESSHVNRISVTNQSPTEESDHVNRMFVKNQLSPTEESDHVNKTVQTKLRGPCPLSRFEVCKEAIEDIFGVPFYRACPTWLTHNLEIEIYNEELKIAVECYGKQHYKYTPLFHRCERNFHEQVRNDKLKADLCDQHGVSLIVVPPDCKSYLIEEFIRNRLHELGIKISSD